MTTPDSGAPGSGAELTIDRRALVRGTALAGVALPLLAACGSDDVTGTTGDPTQGTTAPTPADSPPDSGGAAELVTAADVPVGGGVVLADAKVVVTQPTEGEFKGFTAVCTHQGCIVGRVEEGRIVCPCHGSMFDISDGSVVGGPAQAPLSSVPVALENGAVVQG